MGQWGLLDPLGGAWGSRLLDCDPICDGAAPGQPVRWFCENPPKTEKRHSRPASRPCPHVVGPRRKSQDQLTALPWLSLLVQAKWSAKGQHHGCVYQQLNYSEWQEKKKGTERKAWLPTWCDSRSSVTPGPRLQQML